MQVLQEETSSLQPLKNRLNESAVPHQHNLVYINVVLVITIMYVIKRQDNMLPTRLLRGHNLVSTIADTRVLKTCQEEKPQMTREESLSKSHRHSRSKLSAKSDKYADFLWQSCGSRKRKTGPRRCCSSRKSRRCLLADGG